MFRRFARAASAPVESFLVQAELGPPQKNLARNSILVRHLLSRFQADDNGDEEQAVRGTLFVWATAALPCLFAAVMLYPAYHPLAMPPAHRPYWNQAGDQYLFLLYSLVAMGIASIVQWETIFPDLLDVFALSVLPLPTRLLLRSRWIALAVLFGGVLLSLNALGILLFPGVVESPSILRHYIAHAVATLLAGLFSCTLLIAMQSLLEIAVGPRLAKLLGPMLQTAALLALFILVGFTPVTLANLQQRVMSTAQEGASLNPVLWFLGMYEQLRGVEQARAAWSTLAWRGWAAVITSALIAAAAYPIAYHRRTLFLVESGNAAFPPHRMPNWIVRRLHSSVLKTPEERAIFHFIAQTAFRSSRLRTTLTIYVGLGLAFVLGTSTHNAVRAIAILGCAVALGLVSLIGRPFMLKASWIFDILPAAKTSSTASGSSKLMVLWGTSATLVAALSFLAADLYTGRTGWNAVIVTVSAALVVPKIVSDLLLAGFGDFPFVEQRENTAERYVLLILRNVVVLPLGIVAFAWLAARASQSVLGVLLFTSGLISAALLLPCVLAYFRRLTNGSSARQAEGTMESL